MLRGVRRQYIRGRRSRELIRSDGLQVVRGALARTGVLHDIEVELLALDGRLKDELAGEISVSGPELAQSLTEVGLIDEYRLYFHPVVLGRGKPFFAGPRPPLRLVASNLIDEDTIRLTYVPR